MASVRRCAACLALAPATVLSQSESLVRSEVRTDAILARVSLVHAGVGVAFRTGYNVRAHIAAGGGVAIKDGEHTSSVRADATLRLLLDPFGETRAGLSIGGGVGVLHDGFEKTRPVGILVLGLEGPPRKPVVWGLEAALGGGVRVGVVLRRRVGRYR